MRHIDRSNGLILTAVAALLALSPAWSQSMPAGPKVGAVSQQAYAGAVAQANSGLQRPIKYSNPVFATEMVRTGPDGSTELQFLDQARLHIGANASLQLDQYAYDEASGNGSGLVEMFVGAYDFVSGNMKTDDKVKLVTPTVTIGLRGTALSIYVAGDGRTDIAVKEGLVSLAPCKFGVVATISAGQRATVDNSCQVTFPDAQKEQLFQPLRRQDYLFKKPRAPRPPKPPKSQSSGG
jgi:hypothetical protein